jgi:hypothetical protein
VADSQDILDALVANLGKPKRARTEAGEVEQHDLSEQVAAAEFALRLKAAKASPFSQLKFAQTVSPSATNSTSDPQIASFAQDFGVYD